MGLIEEEFRSRIARSSGRIDLFRPLDALQVVRRAQEEGIAVLGLDAFIAWTDGIQPFQEHTLELSSSPPDDSWREASAFLARYAGTSYMFEVALDEQPP